MTITPAGVSGISRWIGTGTMIPSENEWLFVANEISIERKPDIDIVSIYTWWTIKTRMRLRQSFYATSKGEADQPRPDVFDEPDCPMGWPIDWNER